MQLICPTCHAAFPFEAALKDDAGREFADLVGNLQPELKREMTHYLSYFRPAKQQLGWGRALRMAREVLALQADHALLQRALIDANAGLAEKRAQPGWAPLGNHNYLRRVLETVQARQAGVCATPALDVIDGGARRAPATRTGQALGSLQDMKR